MRPTTSRISCRLRLVRIFFIFLGLVGGLVSTSAHAATRADDIGAADLVVKVVRGELGGTEREIAIKDNVFSEENIETGSDPPRGSSSATARSCLWAPAPR